MPTVVSHQTAHGLKDKSSPLSDVLEPISVDDVRKDQLLTQCYSNGKESWCYWVPFPGVRYYCYGERARTTGPVEQSR